MVNERPTKAVERTDTALSGAPAAHRQARYALILDNWLKGLPEMAPAQRERIDSYTTFLLLFAAVGGLQMAYWWLVSISIREASDRGLFGDMFGGFTALVSGLAFAGMIYAIILQSRELALQREELKLTREDMVAARGEYARAAGAQQEMVEKQMLTARIQGMAAISSG